MGCGPHSQRICTQYGRNNHIVYTCFMKQITLPRDTITSTKNHPSTIILSLPLLKLPLILPKILKFPWQFHDQYHQIIQMLNQNHASSSHGTTISIISMLQIPNINYASSTTDDKPRVYIGNRYRYHWPYYS